MGINLPPLLPKKYKPYIVRRPYHTHRTITSVNYTLRHSTCLILVRNAILSCIRFGSKGPSRLPLSGKPPTNSPRPNPTQNAYVHPNKSSSSTNPQDIKPLKPSKPSRVIDPLPITDMSKKVEEMRRTKAFTDKLKSDFFGKKETSNISPSQNQVPTIVPQQVVPPKPPFDPQSAYQITSEKTLNSKMLGITNQRATLSASSDLPTESAPKTTADAFTPGLDPSIITSDSRLPTTPQKIFSSQKFFDELKAVTDQIDRAKNIEKAITQLEAQRDFMEAVNQYKDYVGSNRYKEHIMDIKVKYPQLPQMISDFGKSDTSFDRITNSLNGLTTQEKAVVLSILLTEYGLIKNDPISGEQTTYRLRDLRTSKPGIIQEAMITELRRKVSFTMQVYNDPKPCTDKELPSGELKHALVGYTSEDGKYFISFGYLTSQTLGNIELSPDQPFAELKMDDNKSYPSKKQYIKQFPAPRAIPINDLHKLTDTSYRDMGDAYLSRTDVLLKLEEIRKKAPYVVLYTDPGFTQEDILDLLNMYRNEQLRIGNGWFLSYKQTLTSQDKNDFATKLKSFKKSNSIAYDKFCQLKKEYDEKQN